MSGRCKACDKKLTDYEMTRKFAETGTYVDLCTKCYNSSELEVIDRPDLMKTEDVENDFEETDDIFETRTVSEMWES